jgi:hypothetical protein
MKPKWARIQYTTATDRHDSFEIVNEPSINRLLQVEPIYEDMMAQLATLPLYPYDTPIGNSGQILHDFLYEIVREHCIKIARLLEPQIYPDLMEKSSRHSFFICTEPVDIDGYDKPVVGLSILQELLQRSLPGMMPEVEKEVGELNEEPITSGDFRADIAASLSIAFKGDGLAYLNYPLSFAVNALRQAGELYKKVDPENKKKQQARRIYSPPTLEVEVGKIDSGRFDRAKPLIMQKLDEMGIKYPDGF